MGALGLRRLVELIEAKNKATTSQPETVTLATELIVRDSVGEYNQPP